MNDSDMDDANWDAAEVDPVEQEEALELDELSEDPTPVEADEADWLEQHQEVAEDDDDYPPSP